MNDLVPIRIYDAITARAVRVTSCRRIGSITGVGVPVAGRVRISVATVIIVTGTVRIPGICIAVGIVIPVVSVGVAVIRIIAVVRVRVLILVAILIIRVVGVVRGIGIRVGRGIRIGISFRGFAADRHRRFAFVRGRAADDDRHGLPRLDDLAGVGRLIQDRVRFYVRAIAGGAAPHVQPRRLQFGFAGAYFLAHDVRDGHLWAVETGLKRPEESADERRTDHDDDQQFSDDR